MVWICIRLLFMDASDWGSFDLFRAAPLGFDATDWLCFDFGRDHIPGEMQCTSKSHR